MLETIGTSGEDKITSYFHDVTPTDSRKNHEIVAQKLKARTKSQIYRAQALGLIHSSTKFDLTDLLPRTIKLKLQALCQKSPVVISINSSEMIVNPLKQLKQLGVIIDESITFKNYAKHAASQGVQPLAQLQFLRSDKSGIFAHVAHHLTRSIILLRMLRASPVW